jgi:hypothetical protein
LTPAVLFDFLFALLRLFEAQVFACLRVLAVHFFFAFLVLTATLASHPLAVWEPTQSAGRAKTVFPALVLVPAAGVDRHESNNATSIEALHQRAKW